jgi:hypothetical protein
MLLLYCLIVGTSEPGPAVGDGGDDEEQLGGRNTSAAYDAP